jgi:site-specific recombinase XerC
MTTRQPLINHRGKPTLSDKPAIEAYLRERIDDGSGLFFTGQKGRLTRWTLDKMFRRVSSARISRGEQAIPEEAQRFHAIKHTGVTFVAQGSKDLLATKDWAGHASISDSAVCTVCSWQCVRDGKVKGQNCDRIEGL